MRGEFPDASGNICASTKVPGYPGVIECHPDCCTCKYMTIAFVRGFPWYGTPLIKRGYSAQGKSPCRCGSRAHGGWRAGRYFMTPPGGKCLHQRTNLTIRVGNFPSSNNLYTAAGSWPSCFVCCRGMLLHVPACSCMFLHVACVFTCMLACSFLHVHVHVHVHGVRVCLLALASQQQQHSYGGTPATTYG